jgi:hypothetical protein
MIKLFHQQKCNKSSFKYDSDGYPTERVTENAKKANLGYLKTEYIYKIKPHSSI